MAFYLNAARVNARLTQEEVALALNLSKSTIVSYEKYRSKPNISVAQKIAELYGLTIDDIIWA